MSYYLYIIILINFLFSCKKDQNEVKPAMNPVISKTYTILALGDSYTIGQSVPVSDRYPVQLAARLKEDSLKVKDVKSPKIIATTGWTTANLIQAINADGDTGKYDCVLLLIGVNNQFQGKSLAEYRDQFRILLNRSIQFAGNKADHVFVVSIPDYAYTPFSKYSDKQKTTYQIDQFNAVNKEESLAIAGVNYIYITDLTRSDDPTLVADDGLHPSGKSYGLWVDRILPEVKKKL